MAIAALLALTVGWSRAYLHVHYPSDVLGGWLLGLVWYATLRQLILPDSEHRSKSGDRGPCSAADTC
jgi:membrane-associated phospholipid phosphatase